MKKAIRSILESTRTQSSEWDIARVRGAIGGDPSCVRTALVAGPKRAIADVNALFFHGEGSVEPQGSCLGWRARAALAKMASKSDAFTVVQRPYWTSTRRSNVCFFRNTIDSRMPHGIPHSDYVSGISKSLRQTLRKAEEASLRFVRSASLEDLRFFYETMMVPLGKSRHGKLNWLPPIGEFEAVWPHLALFFVESEGKRVAGEIFLKTGRRLTEWRFGLTEELLEDSKRFAMINCFCTSEFMRYAFGQGFREISMGQVMSVLSNGILQFKRKWNSSFVSIPEYPLYALRVEGRAALELFSRVPLVVERGGSLEAWTAVESIERVPEHANLLRASVWPGLSVRVLVPSREIEAAVLSHAAKSNLEPKIFLQD